MYTDSHCHLAMAGEKTDEVLALARSNGVRGFMVPATKLDDFEIVVSIAEGNDDVWAAVGFHPHEAKDFDATAEVEARRLLRNARVKAVGEIGLDYYYDHSPREIQREVFARQAKIAIEHGLPIIVHNRESTTDLLELLTSDELKGSRGVLHSFTESYEVARTLIDLGFFISFSGIVTFKTAQSLRDTAARLPHDRVLIETDSPFLAPVPHRGKENQPAYVLGIADVLAQLWGTTREYVGDVTSQNFELAFDLVLPR